MKYNYSIDESSSKFHKRVIEFLREEYPLFDVLQESPIKIDNHTLFCDIMIKSPIKMIIEINPRQHFEFVPFFHKTMALFKQAQMRDKLKEKWATMNDYLFLVLKEEDFKGNNFENKIKEILT
jgi:hypothetical protein